MKAATFNSIDHLSLAFAVKEQIDAEIALGIAQKRLAVAAQKTGQAILRANMPILEAVESATFIRRQFGNSL